MAFEIFARKVLWKGSPSVTFSKLGRFSFNKSATAQFEKNAIENVLLLWDAEKRLIGVRPITKKDARSYKVHMGKNGNGCGFSASTFLKYIGYDITESRSMPAKWDDSAEMFIIEVPEEYLKSNQEKEGEPKRMKIRIKHKTENKMGE
jgi:hypothetical protein